jgi:hypothetical protein
MATGEKSNARRSNFLVVDAGGASDKARIWTRETSAMKSPQIFT